MAECMLGCPPLNPASCSYVSPSPFFCPIHFPFKSYSAKRASSSSFKPQASQSPAPPPSQWAADAVKQLGKAVWGGGLPPGALVGAVREVWSIGWHVMMAQLAPSSKDGAYVRPESKFRRKPSRPVSIQDKGRYHLYVSLTCPWAHRALIVHTLKGLGQAVPLSVVVPNNTGLWIFDDSQTRPNLLESENAKFGATKDRANGCKRLADVYKLSKGGYEGRSTVPMLWDSVEKIVVNNESADIIQILNSDFNEVAQNSALDLAPSHLIEQIEHWNSVTYANVNNGVYRCGFAQSQEAYEGAIDNLFSALDKIDIHLATSRYLCGSQLTLADVRLFTTLFRFDAVYYILFKCSRQKISEYPNLYNYLKDIYQFSEVSSTCDLPTIMDGYYKVLFPINPGAIRPVIPLTDLSNELLRPHGRESLVYVHQVNAVQ